jgi:hypothetical protein
MKKLGLVMKKKKRDKPININWEQIAYSYRSGFVAGMPIAEDWNVCYASLDLFNIGWDEEAYTFPMYNSDEHIIGIQRRFPDGSKCCVEGSQLGLFIPRALKFNTLFICEGCSDAVAVYDLGFDAIGRPSCNSCVEIVCQWVGINEDIKHIIIIPDNDEVGKDGAKELHKCLNMDFGEITDIFEYAGAKDIREYIQRVGKSRVREELEQYV